MDFSECTSNVKIEICRSSTVRMDPEGRRDDLTDYCENITVKILDWDFDKDEDVEIGKILASRINIENIDEDGGSIFDLMDAESQDFTDFASALNRSGRLNALCDHIVIIDRMEVCESHRGRGIGTLAMKKFLEAMCDRHLELVLVQPFPLEWSGKTAWDGRVSPPEFKKALSRIRGFWRKFGFKKIRGTEIYCAD